jgi:hypothetical protein
MSLSQVPAIAMLKDMEWFRRNKRKRGGWTDRSQYVDEIEKKIERQVEFRGQGRPGKLEK